MSSDATNSSSARRTRLHPAWRFVRSLLLGYLIVLLLMMFLEKRLLFVPAKYPAGDWQPVNLPIKEATFTSADGTALHGWYLEHEQPRAVVLLAGGNGGNVTQWADTMRALHEVCNASVLAFDYRGYGRSEGSPDEPGILADARAARSWLANRAKVNEADIVLLGRSLGGGVMVDLAAKDGARGLILERTYTSLPDVASLHYRWLPVRLLMQTQLNSLNKIGNYHGPLLQSHGDEDEVIPYQLGQQLFAAANEPKEFIVIERGTHNEGHRPGYFSRVKAFIERLPPAGDAP